MTSYLVGAYAASSQSLYSRMLFRNLVAMMKEKQIQFPKVLDLGCADSRGRGLLEKYWGSNFEYFGVDIDENFQPNHVADIRDVKRIFEEINFKPDIILLNDVLEHFDNGKQDIENFLAGIVKHAPKDSLIYITVPQIYRLDCFKLPHLHYPEHQVRFTSIEWASLVGRNFEIQKTQTASYLTGLPYWLMLSSRYRDNNTLGKTFKYIRNKMNRYQWLEQLDQYFVTKWGGNPLLYSLSNGLIFECVRR